MTKPKKGAEKLIKTIIFPYRLNLTVLRKLQELLSELGMGMFISYSAEADKQLKRYTTLTERVIRLLYFLTPQNIFLSTSFNKIIKYKTLDEYFSRFESYSKLKEYYNVNKKLPITDEWYSYFIDLLKIYLFNLNFTYLLTLLLTNPAEAGKYIWNQIGQVEGILTASTLDTLQILEKNIRFKEEYTLYAIIHPQTSILINPFADLYFAVITSAILLKDSYELEDLTTTKLQIKLRNVRRYLHYGTSKLLKEDGTVIEEWIKPERLVDTRTVTLNELPELKAAGETRLKLWHEGVESDEITLYGDIDFQQAWTTHFHDFKRSKRNPYAKHVVLLLANGTIRIYNENLEVLKQYELNDDQIRTILADRQKRIWAITSYGKIYIIDTEQDKISEINLNHSISYVASLDKDDNLILSTYDSNLRETVIRVINDKGEEIKSRSIQNAVNTLITSDYSSSIYFTQVTYDPPGTGGTWYYRIYYSLIKLDDNLNTVAEYRNYITRLDPFGPDSLYAVAKQVAVLDDATLCFSLNRAVLITTDQNLNKIEKLHKEYNTLIGHKIFTQPQSFRTSILTVWAWNDYSYGDIYIYNKYLEEKCKVGSTSDPFEGYCRISDDLFCVRKGTFDYYYINTRGEVEYHKEINIFVDDMIAARRGKIYAYYNRPVTSTERRFYLYIINRNLELEKTADEKGVVRSIIAI